MPAVAMTDRDGLYGAARFTAACAREGVRPIYGASLTVRMVTGDRRVLRLAADASLPAVATNGVRYLVSQDAFLADVLECMREIVPLASHHLSRRNAEGWLKPADEMRELFVERPDLCDRTLQ